jgi:hypothetical protein
MQSSPDRRQREHRRSDRTSGRLNELRILLSTWKQDENDKWEQEFVNHKVILAMKTACGNPNGATVTNVAKTKDVTVQNKNFPIR